MKRSLTTLGMLSIIITGCTISDLSGANAATPNPKRKFVGLTLPENEEQEAVKMFEAKRKNSPRPTRMQVAQRNVRPSTIDLSPAAPINIASKPTRKFFTSKRWVVGSLIVSLAFGILFGQVKYKMISRMFKAAPVTPANAVKVSWLKALTGLSTR